MAYIKNVKFKNIRGFLNLNIDFGTENFGTRMRTLIIGRNGTCKSTLLRCIAIGLCDPEEGNGLIAEPIGRLIGDRANEATITIEIYSDMTSSESHTIKTVLKSKNGKEIVANQIIDRLPLEGTPFFVCGYGAGRSIGATEGFREYRIIDSVYTLFRYDTGLTNSELTLRRLRDFVGTKKYEKTIMGIKRVLNLSPNDQIELPKGGGVTFSGTSIGKNIPLEGLADGYKETFFWLMDLYAWAMRANNLTSSGGIEGILLIDELEQHLHPSMQSDMLPRISNLFPGLQIIATTHSPLPVLGSSPMEVVALKRKRKYVYNEDNIPDFSGSSAEDILVDDRLFDTAVYSPETSKKLRKYHRLAKIPKQQRSSAQKQELRLMARELKSHQLSELRESPLVEELREFRKKFDL